MLKALIFSALIALVAAAALSSDESSSGEGNCPVQGELWGSEDGTKFYFCLPGTDTVIEQTCPPNTFFVKNATSTGCLGLSYVNPACLGTTDPVGSCTDNNLNQPQPAMNPSQFYLCPSENATPVLLNCPEGTAFYKANGYLGCFQWSEWRQMRDCPE